MLTTFLITFLIIVPTYEFLRRYRDFSTLFFLFTPIFLTFIWIGHEDMDWFKWVKVYSASMGALLINISRYKRFSRSQRLFTIIYVILGINILEAVIRDTTNLDTASLINIFIGSSLILTLFKMPHNLRVSQGKVRDLLAPNLNLIWIICYNIWDWVYIYGEYPDFAMRHIFILNIPLVMEVFRRGTWLQIRAFTLTTYLFVSFTIPSQLEKILPTMTYNSGLALTLALLNLFILATYLITLYRKDLYAEIIDRKRMLLHSFISFLKR